MVYRNVFIKISLSVKVPWNPVYIKWISNSVNEPNGQHPNFSEICYQLVSLLPIAGVGHLFKPVNSAFKNNPVLREVSTGTYKFQKSIFNSLRMPRSNNLTPIKAPTILFNINLLLSSQMILTLIFDEAENFWIFSEIKFLTQTISFSIWSSK